MCTPGAHGSSKGPKRSKIAQAASSAIQVVRARSTQVKQKPEACGDCTSCIIDGTSCARQEYTGRVKARGVRRLHKLHHRRYKLCAPGVHELSKESRRAEIAQAASSAV